MKIQTLKNLIIEYLAQVKKATDLLEQSFGTKTFLDYGIQKNIPQQGSVTEDVTYELHGIGCSVYLSEICVDFDHGPDERIDGFGSWRLYMYACEVPSKYKKYTNSGAAAQPSTSKLAHHKRLLTKGLAKALDPRQRQIQRKVGKNQIRTRPFDRAQGLANHAVLINRPRLGAELDHRVFTAYLICRHRQA